MHHAATEHSRRAQIIAAANDHFRQYGYAKTTVGDLARAVGFSTAYVYKFFASKQAIGEAICGLCLNRIAADLQGVVGSAMSASERLRALFRLLSHHAREMTLRESRLREIVIAAHVERWQVFVEHEATLRAALVRIVEDGRRLGEFERKTSLEETCRGIALVLEPLRNPVLWTRRLDDDEATALAALVLRSLVV